MSDCANHRCKDKARPGQLACRACWFALPAPLRAAINSTWANRKQNGMGAWSENVLQARIIWNDQHKERTP